MSRATARPGAKEDNKAKKFKPEAKAWDVNQEAQAP